VNPIDKIAWILIQNRKVLYVRTVSKELFYNAGGKREGSETDKQALIREIKEELNVDLVPESIEYLETFSAQAAGKPEGVMVEIKCYQARYHGLLTPVGEIEELAWFTSDDMERTSITGQLTLAYLKEHNLID